MTFLELKVQFETKLKENSQFELLELNYIPYAFGSGFVAYRISGRNIKVIYDGRENCAELLASIDYGKYPNTSWRRIFIGSPSDLLKIDLDEL